jgi:hypothetical protein
VSGDLRSDHLEMDSSCPHCRRTLNCREQSRVSDRAGEFWGMVTVDSWEHGRVSSFTDKRSVEAVR